MVKDSVQLNEYVTFKVNDSVITMDKTTLKDYESLPRKTKEAITAKFDSDKLCEAVIDLECADLFIEESKLKNKSDVDRVWGTQVFDNPTVFNGTVFKRANKETYRMTFDADTKTDEITQLTVARMNIG